MKSFDKDELSKYILMQVPCMDQYLATGGLRWLTKDQINRFDVITVIGDNAEGCILWVDTEYFKELHDLRNNYPPAPEKIKTKECMPSD